MKTYLITNKINGRQYIGETNQSLSNRFSQHACSSRGTMTELKKDMLVYGKQSFTIALIDESEISKEALYIKQYNTLYPNGYNRESGGEKGFTIHEDTRQLMSKAKANWTTPWFNKAIKCIDTNKIYQSCTDACKDLSLDASHLSKVLTGKRQSTGGLRFEYLPGKVG